MIRWFSHVVACVLMVSGIDRLVTALRFIGAADGAYATEARVVTNGAASWEKWGYVGA